MNREIKVYLDMEGSPVVAGRLWCRARRWSNLLAEEFALATHASDLNAPALWALMVRREEVDCGPDTLLARLRDNIWRPSDSSTAAGCSRSGS